MTSILNRCWPNFVYSIFLIFWDPDFPNSFWKKSIPHGSSGQTAMWKRIPYGSSSFQVFIKKCRKYWFLQIRFNFFMITLFSPFVRLRPVQAGFCVSSQTLIFRVIEKINILFGAFLVIYMSNKFPNPSRKMRLEELVWWISF